MIEKLVSMDSRGRVSLGPEYKDTWFKVTTGSYGEVILTPVVLVPKHEAENTDERA
jgi:hypothetical protein